MADTEVKTRRHLVAKAALSFPIVRDDAGNIKDLGAPEIILDTDDLLSKLMDPSYVTNNKIVRIDTDQFYK